MAQQVVDRRDQDFLLHEIMNVEELSKTEKFADFNKKTVDMILTEARSLAVNELLPANKTADVENGNPEGVRLENGAVKVPPSYHRPYKLLREGEWIAMTDDLEYGGQGMPRTVATACGELFSGANMAFMMYPGLTHGAGAILKEFGSDKQKKLFLKNMFTGKWGGTMCLTEPEAGSNVGALTTSAKLNDDGTYSITGNKIFISGGDSDMVENVIHPVLARIEGAPEGTKGISLFLVPKIWVNDDGSLGEPNDVIITGVEEKMGIHGSCTCSINFGGKGKCRGTLIGEVNKGMKAMFVMMNEARLGVGLQGYALGSASYVNAVNYARERIQGPNLLKAFDKGAPSVPIIQHPDVRRMLLNMKAYVDGMRALIYYISNCFDQVAIAANEDIKAKYQGLIEILTPISKSYCTDKGFEVCSTGVQVYGGYGFCSEFPQEQLLRDCKITAIYEGTNGIQAMDLLGRKLGMNNGKPMMDLLGEISARIKDAKEAGLEELAGKVEAAVGKLGEIAMHMGKTAMSEKIMDAFAEAVPFQEAAGDVIMAWLHIWRATVATKAISGAKKKDVPFYQGQIKTAQYFIEQLLPVTLGKMEAIKATTSSIMEMPEEAFVM
ncbi:MAG: acyl-CoA dehydrogenase [Proteobacteria bacterium]|nr:acyl-CoA dehydrogenase [Pseudomonadota bacterium]